MKLLIIYLCLFANSVFALKPEKIRPSESKIYKKIGKINLKAHIFNPTDHKNTDKCPAIICFFGGGWKSGHAGQFFRHCQYFSARGIVAISAEYRTQKRHQASPIECVEDAKSMIRWARTNAQQLGIDPNQIIGCGGSAGGHLAAATATLSNYNASTDDTSISCIPNALVLFNPVYDNSKNGYGYDRVKEYWESFSPAHNLTENTPPTIAFFGSEDKHISVETAQAYDTKMKKLGNRSELVIYPEMKHGFFNYGRNNNINFKDTLIKADHFLASLGYLEGEPRPELIPKFTSKTKSKE